MAIDYVKIERPIEIEPLNNHALISWRSIVAGFLVSLFAMMGLIGLGLAIGAMSIETDLNAPTAGFFSGFWFLFSAVISLFSGSYFAARISKFRSGRIGSAQGLVIAALFLAIFLYQTILTIGSVGSSAGSLFGRPRSGFLTSNTAFTNQVYNLSSRTLRELTLRSERNIVTQELVSRIIRGDHEGAKYYLTQETGLPYATINNRVNQLNVEVDRAMNDAKNGTLMALRSSGWTLFGLVVIGALASIGGGALGSANNLRKPLSREVDIPFGEMLRF